MNVSETSQTTVPENIDVLRSLFPEIDTDVVNGLLEHYQGDVDAVAAYLTDISLNPPAGSGKKRVGKNGKKFNSKTKVSLKEFSSQTTSVRAPAMPTIADTPSYNNNFPRQIHDTTAITNEKVGLLLEMFPELNADTIQQVLQESQDNVETTVDTLILHAALYETGKDTGHFVSVKNSAPWSLSHSPTSNNRQRTPKFQELMDRELAEQVSLESQAEYHSFSNSDAETRRMGDWKNPMLTHASSVLKLQQLYDVFPALDVTVLDAVFFSCQCNLQDSIEQIRQKYPEVPVKWEALQASSTPTNVAEPRSLMNIAPSSAILDADLSSEDTESKCQQHATRRNDLLRQAAVAYQRGNAVYAGDLAARAREEYTKMRDARNQVVRTMLQNSSQTNIFRNTTEAKRAPRLDLHHLTVDEAVMTVQDCLVRFRAEPQPPRYLTVITGIGSHSKRGVSPLRTAVFRFLRNTGERFEEMTSGELRVKL